MEPVNITCVLVGDKYTPTDVVRLHTMVSRNLTRPFDFFVYTDQTVDHPWITNISLVDDNSHAHMNKYHQWNLAALPSGRLTMAFDLDLVIKDDITSMLDEIVPGYLTVVDPCWSSWRDISCLVNTSVMGWKSGTISDLYYTFRDREFEYECMWQGLDKPLHCYHYNQIKHFQPTWTYSFLFGWDQENNYWATGKYDWECSRPIVVMNCVGKLTPEDYQLIDPYRKYEQYWT